MKKGLSDSRAGRPKDPTKHAAIVNAATRLFVRRSYDTVTMESVASEAGVSKMTVYSHFTDKETLFEVVVRAISDRMIHGLPEEGSENLPLRERLSVIGTEFLTVIVNVHVTGIAHTLQTVLRDNLSLGKRFYNAGPGRTRAALAVIIGDAAARNELRVDSPELAAQDLISLWEGGIPARTAFGIMAQPTRDEIAQQAQRGTEVFLRAYATTRERL